MDRYSSLDAMLSVPGVSEYERKNQDIVRPASVSAAIYDKIDPQIKLAIQHFAQSRELGELEIHPEALSLIQAEAFNLGTLNIEWVLRSIFAKTTREHISNDEIIQLITHSRISTTIMLFSPIINPGNIHISNRLKKDVPIKAANRPYPPVVGEAITERLIRALDEQIGIFEIIKRYQEKGRPLVVTGKYSGGLVPGLLVARKLGLPFVTLTKMPYNFVVESEDAVIVKVKEPHLPADSVELYSYMLAYPNSGVILIDDEGTTGNVHTNAVRELSRHGIDVEVVAVLLESSPVAGDRMRSEKIPYVCLAGINTSQDAIPQTLEFEPFLDLQVSVHNRFFGPVVENSEFITVPLERYPLTDSNDSRVFVDHPFRGMTMQLDSGLIDPVAENIHQFIDETIDIQKTRQRYFENGKTLFLVGTTPSGLLPAVAVSHSTRIPLLGASNRPEPRGYQDSIVKYTGMDGYTYSIYGVAPGDGVVLVCGELTDGEEQIRIIKSLRDKGVDVLCTTAITENTDYNGREQIEAMDIPVHTLQQHQSDEALYEFNITDKVRSSVVYALAELSREIKKLNRDAQIMRVDATPSSFTRGLMIPGSDFDKIYIYVSGVSQSQLIQLQAKFFSWLFRDDIPMDMEKTPAPVFISVEHLDEMEKRYDVAEKLLVTIYENDMFKSPAEIRRLSNHEAPMLYEKLIARIRLLLGLGELDPLLVSTLLEGEEYQKHPHFQIIADAATDPESLRLSDNARVVALEFDRLYREGTWHYTVAEDKEEDFELALAELRTKGLVSIHPDDKKIILQWRQHVARWSDRYEKRRFEVLLQDGNKMPEQILDLIDQHAYADIDAVINQDGMLASINSDNPLIIERAIRRAGALDAITPEIAESIIDALSIYSISVHTAAMEVMTARPDVFKERIKAAVKNMLEEYTLDDMRMFYNNTLKKLQLLVLILCKCAVNDNSLVDELVDFMDKELIFGNDLFATTVPNMVLQTIIEYFGIIYHKITQPALQFNVYDFIKKQSYSYLEKTEQTARKALNRIGPVDYPMPQNISEIYSAEPGVLNNDDAHYVRLALFKDMEARRANQKPIRFVVSDFDDTLRSFSPGETKGTPPLIAFWLNWLMAYGIDVCIATGAEYERLYIQSIDPAINPIPLRKADTLHLVTHAGVFYNDRRVEYDDFPEHIKQYIHDKLSTAGWVERNDDRPPRIMYVKENPDIKNTHALAAEMEAYFFTEHGYHFPIVVHRILSARQAWAFYVSAIGKDYTIATQLGIPFDPETSISLFDSAYPYGVDEPLLNCTEGGMRINVGRDLTDKEGVYNLSYKGEAGSLLAIEALVASSIMEMLDRGKSFDWEQLLRKLQDTGAFTYRQALDIITPIHALIEHLILPGAPVSILLPACARLTEASL